MQVADVQAIPGDTVRRGRGPGGRKAPKAESESRPYRGPGPSGDPLRKGVGCASNSSLLREAGYISTHFHPSLVVGCPWGVKSLAFPGCPAHGWSSPPHWRNPQALGNPQEEKQNHPLLCLSGAGDASCSGDGGRASKALRLPPPPPWE